MSNDARASRLRARGVKVIGLSSMLARPTRENAAAPPPIQDAWRVRHCMLGALLSMVLVGPASAEKLVIVEARGIGSTAGQVVDSHSRLKLRLGERVRLIGENGNQYCIEGPYDGPARPLDDRAGSRNLFSSVGKTQTGHTPSPLTDCLR